MKKPHSYNKWCVDASTGLASLSRSTRTRQVKPLNSSFLQDSPVDYISPEDMDDLQSIHDVYQGVRRHISCVACQGTGEFGESVVSCCCFAFSCKMCITKFFVQSPKRCMACNLNWGPFRLSQVLVEPPCAEYSNLTNAMRDQLTLKWNTALETISPNNS